MPRRALCWLTLTALLSGAAAAVAPSVDGHWIGEIEVPGRALAFDVDFFTEEGELRGDLSIPVQGLQDRELVDVSLDGDSVTFALPGIPGDPSFTGTLSADGEAISGTFTQGGTSLDFSMRRGDEPAEQARAALADFDDFVTRAVADWNVPGAGLAVVAGGEVVYAGGFGRRDLEAELPMTADTLFAIGSTTKAFTTTLLGMLVDEGKLAWDEPLTHFLPEFRLSDPVATRLLTPRDLVTHRSGLPRHDLVWYNNHHSSREEVVARLAHLELSEPPRARWQYNNLLFMTAGYLAGRLTGGTWEEALRERILEPLGMERTNFSVDESQRDADHALPYRENDEDELERIPFRRIDLIGPAGSLNSSVNEMASWLLFNLGGGAVADTRLISASTLSDIHSPHMTTGETPERREISQSTYGLGWSIDTYRGHRRVAHGGGIDGFSTSVMLFPDDGLGLVAFTNRGSGLPSILNRHATDRVLGLDPIDWNGEALEELEAGKQAAREAEQRKGETRVETTSPSHSLADYAGDYEHPGYGTLRVELDGERLVAHYNGIATPLEHWHYDVWSGGENEDDPTFENMKYQFRANVDGIIGSLEAPFEPRTDPIVFAKRPDSRLSDPAYLARFVGTYALPGQEVTVGLSGSTLTLTLPGQPVFTLEPEISGRFVLAEVAIVKVGFRESAEGEVTAAVFYQPNGVFEAEKTE